MFWTSDLCFAAAWRVKLLLSVRCTACCCVHLPTLPYPLPTFYTHCTPARTFYTDGFPLPRLPSLPQPYQHTYNTPLRAPARLPRCLCATTPPTFPTPDQHPTAAPTRAVCPDGLTTHMTPIRAACCSLRTDRCLVHDVCIPLFLLCHSYSLVVPLTRTRLRTCCACGLLYVRRV